MLNKVDFRGKYVSKLVIGFAILATLAILVDNSLPVKWGDSTPVPIAISGGYVVETYFGHEFPGIRDLHNCMGVGDRGQIVCCSHDKNPTIMFWVDEMTAGCSDRDYKQEAFWRVYYQMPDISFNHECNTDQQECGQFITGYGPDEEPSGPFCWTWPSEQPFFELLPQSEEGS